MTRDPLEGTYIGSLGNVGQRARRKDATGRKSDYHKSSTTVTVRMPLPLAEKLRARAEAQSQSVNALLVDIIGRALGT